MNKLDLQTPDFTSVNIARLAELFPNCVTETKNPDGTLKRAIDFDLLSQELSHDLVEGPQERYRLDWPGKREALALANAPIRKTLRPARDESVDFDTTRNLYIEGDNLDALKLLQETYLGQVKMIYIDPPYNTGNDFIYEDDFTADREEYERGAGVRDEKGNKMIDEERWKQNSSSNGRFHSDWLSMIYSRLRLAKNLLTADGILFISIDDGEVANLREIGNEVFGETNFVANVIWQKKFAPQNDAKYFSSSHDHVLVYSRDKLELRLNLLPRSEKATARYVNKDNDPRGPWASSDLLRMEHRDNCVYEIASPSGELWKPKSGTSWRHPEKEMLELIRDNQVWFGEDGGSKPRRKRFLADVKDGVVPETIWLHDAVGHNQEGTKIVKDLFSNDGAEFSNPKPVRLIEQMLRISTHVDSIILDFFSGSATTAHAVMQLNAEDGGTRRHIMVQLPEPCDEKSEAFKAGYKTIAEIGKERIRRAGARLKDELRRMKDEERGDELFENSAPRKSKTSSFNIHPSYLKNPQGLDVGFRVLKIDSSNMADVYYQPDELTQDTLALHVDNLKPDRKPEDLLFQVLLDWGVDLALPIAEEKIEGRRVFFVDDNALAACFDTGLDEDFVKILAKRAPLRAVFRDAGYASDAAKINIEQIFKALSPHTELKTL